MNYTATVQQQAEQQYQQQMQMHAHQHYANGGGLASSQAISGGAAGPGYEVAQESGRSSNHNTFDNRQPSGYDQQPGSSNDQHQWAQKVAYSQQPHLNEMQPPRYGTDMQVSQQRHHHSSKSRRAPSDSRYQGGNNGATKVDGISLDFSQIQPAVNRSTVASSAKHGSVNRSSHEKGSFFTATQGASGSTPQGGNPDGLNKTQVIQSSVLTDVNKSLNTSNDRSNRINLHRSTRQRSHQNNQGSDPAGGVHGYDSGVPEVTIKLKKNNPQATAPYYGSGQNQSGASDLGGQFYSTQKIETTALLASEEKRQQMHQKGQDQNESLNVSEQNSRHHQNQSNGHHQTAQSYGGLQIGQSSQQNVDMRVSLHQRPSVERTQAQASHQHAQPGQTNHKKKVQPPQPRNREEATSRRSGAAASRGHNKSSETTNSYDQSSQNSTDVAAPQPQTNPSSYQVQRQAQNPQRTDNTDKFSQLVTQVPQGANAPQMAQNAGYESNIPQSPQQQQQYLLGPQRASEAGRKTLVLDLDETLVHSSFKPVEDADIMLPVEIDGQVCTIYVLVRPFVAQFLKRMHKIYELVIFTASLSKYAEPLMQNLDPGKMCSYLLFREHCTFFNSAYVKDLTRLGRPMTDVIIVDNSPVAYLFQPENAMPAVNWYDDPTDTELNRIATLLEKMVHEDDVRKIIRTIIVNNKIDPRQEQLYLAASQQHRRDKSQRVGHRAKVSKLNPQGATAGASQQSAINAVVVDSPTSASHQKGQRSSHHQRATASGADNLDLKQLAASSATKEAQASSRAQLKLSSERDQSNLYQAPHSQVKGAGVGGSGAHSRYDSSDTRQRNAALISEEINQRKREGQDNLDVDIVLSNMQKINQQRPEKKGKADQGYQADIKQNVVVASKDSNDIQQAYQHHKNQILQLKNEIAALKSQQQSQGPTTQQHNIVKTSQPKATNEKQNQSTAHRRSNAQQASDLQTSTQAKGSKASSSQVQQRHQQTAGVQSNQDKTTPGKATVTKTKREGSRHAGEVQQSNNTKTSGVQQISSKTGTTAKAPHHQQRHSYKLLSTNEIQLVNYLKNTNQGTAGGTGGQQRQSLQVADKKGQLVVREAGGQGSGNQSQLHNTKQIIKLIKKSEGGHHHSNYDVSARQNFTQIIDPALSSKNQTQSSQAEKQSHHPATTKSQAKQHFAFASSGGSANQPSTQGASSTQQQSQFQGQINMISSSGSGAQAQGGARGQLASRTSSKATKTNYSTATGGSSNVRTSYSTAKHGNSSKGNAAQSSLQAHERISAASGGVMVPGTGSQAPKRSSSVKNNGSTTASHTGANRKREEHQSRKNNNSAGQNGYSNLASYDQPGHGHHRRERGSSAQPTYAGGSSGGHGGPSVNPLLVTNIVNRSSSTTNKSKKVNSIGSGATGGNFHNLVLNGSHSTKHSHQRASGDTGVAGPSNSVLHQGASHHAHYQRGGSHDRHQKSSSATTNHYHHSSSGGNQVSTSTRGHSQRNKSSSGKTTGVGGTSDRYERGASEHHKTDQGKSSKQSQQFNLKQQQEHLQRMQQMTTAQSHHHAAAKQAMSATQRISPGTMLNLAANQNFTNGGQNSQQLLNQSLTPSHHQTYHGQGPTAQAALVKQNLKDIQVQDMLRLTQSGPGSGQPAGYFGTAMSSSSTRNQKQVAQISGHHSMVQPGSSTSNPHHLYHQEADDFLQKVKMQQQVPKGSSAKDAPHLIDMTQRRPSEKGNGKSGVAQGQITVIQQEAVSKSSQGHQPGTAALTIGSPKYATSTHGNLQPNDSRYQSANGGVVLASSSAAANRAADQQKILNDIMNMTNVQREQKSGSAATSYAAAAKQIQIQTSNQGVVSQGTTTGGHQIKKIRISSTRDTNGRMSGQSNQSAPNTHKSSGLKRGDSNHSRGSHSSAIHQVIRTSASGTSKSRDQGRHAHLFNQTVKLKDTGSSANAQQPRHHHQPASSAGGIVSLLGELGHSLESGNGGGKQGQVDKEMKGQTAADLFLQSHNAEDQFSQTQQFFGTGGSNQLREVTRHFYNQISQQTGNGKTSHAKKNNH